METKKRIADRKNSSVGQTKNRALKKKKKRLLSMTVKKKRKKIKCHLKLDSFTAKQRLQSNSTVKIDFDQEMFFFLSLF